MKIHPNRSVRMEKSERQAFQKLCLPNVKNENDQQTFEYMLDDIDELESQIERLVAALQKIANPKKYHHLEPNDYTQVACFMFVADECLKSVGKNSD